jgi:hypothetical protein
LECHRVLRRERTTPHTLNDVDLVVSGFDAVPGTLAAAFLAIHIHPKAPPGRLVLQLADPEERLRIDLFSPYGNTLARSGSLQIGGMPLVSIEDLAARAAQLCSGLAREEVPRKHAEDFQLLDTWADPAAVENAWGDHRREGDPVLFREARARIHELLQSRPELLVVPTYSQDFESVCAKCEQTAVWSLAAKPLILSCLGHC